MSMPKAPLTQDFPAALPTGERALWRGGPGIAGLARHALHVRKLAVYFGLLAVWRLIAVWRDGFSIDAATNALVTTGLLAFAVIAALALYARYSARSTSYSITTERVVIRTGIALPITVNLPFSKIASVDVRRRANGSGDIELTLNEGARAFVNHPRGARLDGGDLRVSSIYHWFKADFGGNDSGVIAHLNEFATDPRSSELANVSRIADHSYDWSLNGV